MKSKISILLFAAISIFIYFNRDQQNRNQITSDKYGYYLYLPAICIYQDLSKLNFSDSVNNRYHNAFRLYEVNTNKLDKYPVGVALFEFPLFIIADSFCKTTHIYKRDGFTLPYQLAFFFSQILVVTLGFFILRNLLKKWFNDSVISITILCIAFGTNLYVYTAFDVGMSHPYSFFLFSCLISLTDNLYDNTLYKKISVVVTLSIVMGFIFIVRPINVISVVVPVFWGVDNLRALKTRFLFFKDHYTELFSGLLFFLIPLAIQFSYWRYITGKWLYYSYKGEYFDFQKPHIIDGLFSYRKGWFIYSPMIVLCFIGFYFLYKKKAEITHVLVLFFILIIYCVFSWQEWWYGGGFSCRPLIETLPFLSLPLAALIERVYPIKSKLTKSLFFALLGFLITLNIFQSYQYSSALIHWDRMTREYYWRAFGKITHDKRDDKYLIKQEDENKIGN